MGRTCTVCSADDRDEVDLELAGGKTRRAVATQFGRSEASVRRHAFAHLVPELSHAAADRTLLRLGPMVGRLVAMAERADAILAEAMQPGGDRRLALAAMRECRETLAAVTRLAEPGTAETANMLAEAKLLVAALGMVLPAYRDTAQALADRLELTGAEELAASVRSLLEPLSSPLRDCS